jgi:hypothetical protein
MIYWLKTRAERAMAAYLATILPGSMRVYRSRDLTPRQFPCAVVRVDSCRRYAGQESAVQIITGSVVVLCEFAREVDDSARVLTEFEETQEESVTAVFEALQLDATELATALTATGSSGVVWSGAWIGDDTGRVADSSEDGLVAVETVAWHAVIGPKEL